VKALIAERLGDANHKMSSKITSPMVSSKRNTFVVAKMEGNVDALPTIFRSYTVLGEPKTKCAIWEAARATTAAPTFFKSMNIGTPSIPYIDGGLGANNPSRLALAESRSIWGLDTKVCLLSIGTGHQRGVSVVSESQLEKDFETQQSMFKAIQSSLSSISSKIPVWKTAAKIPDGLLALLKMANALQSVATDTESTHETLQNEAEGKFPYFRFNVERDVGDIGLQDWKKQQALTTNTIAYLRESDSKKKKIECSRVLTDPLAFYR
jgi:predicted acylesterase/phospholipase RssA